MEDAAFEQEKKKYLKQKTLSLEIMNQTIADKVRELKSNNCPEEVIEKIEKSRAIASDAVDRIGAANHTELRLAVQNADQALSSAYEQLNSAS